MYDKGNLVSEYTVAVILFQDGLSLCVDGIEYIFKGTIALVPGDNLASQYLGGYKALNAALRKCRQCMATVEDMTSGSN